MTQEQKAKAYDEAIERARALNNGEDIEVEAGTTTCEYIFPELKETKDEGIRGAIIDHLKDNNLTEWADWLEKQDTLIEEIKRREELLIKEREKETSSFSKLSLAGRIAMLEELLAFVNGNQGEWKPVDKVEPKFHQGKWIVWQDKCYKVNDNGCGYELIDQNGLSTSLEYGTIDENAHLWDITKDAKDGEVLCSGQIILLFKEWEYSDCNFVIAYAGIDVSGKLQITDKHWLISNYALPATKEQCDALTKAMNDAGYVFDFEKKELKKIEDEIEVPFAAKGSELQETAYYIPKGFHAEIDDDKVVIKKGEKPTTWSEEDSARLQRIIDFLWHNRKGDTDTIYQQEQDIDWLKSLKPQPKQDWSKEDKVMLDEIIDFFENGTVKLQHDLSLYASWLKSLKIKTTYNQ